MNPAEQVDRFLDVFLNWQSVLMSFGVFVVVGLVRKIGTQVDGKGAVVGGFAQNKLFRMLLPLYPYALATMFCLVPKAPLPDVVKISAFTKILYGLYTGWLSALSVQLIKGILEKAGAKIPGDA
jgi:hypothetical protein